MGGLLPGLALVFNAFVWGTAWWPFRHLQGHGLHPLWATAIVFTLASLAIVAARPRSVRQLLTTPPLWILVTAAGITNASFNWAVTIGDVVRVVLLFYLMPLWTVLLARIVLHERLTAAGWLRIGLGLAGAVVVLWPEGDAGSAASALGRLPLPSSLADWLGVVGGFSFALNNVMLRRQAHQPEEGRALAMFVGGAIVAAALAVLLTSTRGAAPPPALAIAWVLPLAGLALLFLFGNLALQYGAARLPANRTSVVMLTEVLFASASAIALGASVLTGRVAIGGGLIVAGALLAATRRGASR